MATALRGFEMVGVGEALRPTERALQAPGADEAVVEVAGCGLCHTDLGFLHEGVPTRHPLPLILGHEISGVVVDAGPGHASLIGQAVVVPAVIPCGQCADCLAGQPMICRKQVMPGNDRDGGFASHVTVPARALCPVPGFTGSADAALSPVGVTLRQLSVIADAVSTPYQALVRSGLQAGQVVIVVGLGGVGGYAAQIAAARGAHVVGIDIDPQRLQRAPGLALAIDPREQSSRDIKAQVAAFADQVGAPRTRQIVLECSGSAPGQRLAFDLLVHGGTLCVVGFTLARVELRLSNLMAFDARALGNWGCAPELYPEILDLVLSGAIDVQGQVELRPLEAINQAFDDVHQHRVSRRLVLVP